MEVQNYILCDEKRQNSIEISMKFMVIPLITANLACALSNSLSNSLPRRNTPHYNYNISRKNQEYFANLRLVQIFIRACRCPPLARVQNSKFSNSRDKYFPRARAHDDSRYISFRVKSLNTIKILYNLHISVGERARGPKIELFFLFSPLTLSRARPKQIPRINI